MQARIQRILKVWPESLVSTEVSTTSSLPGVKSQRRLRSISDTTIETSHSLFCRQDDITSTIEATSPTMSEPATEEPITKTEDVKEEVKDNGAEAKPADNAEGADAEKPSDATGPKEETEGDATGDGDEDAPTLVEAKPNSEDGKMIKDLDDEAPRTFPQVVRYLLATDVSRYRGSLSIILFSPFRSPFLSLPADGYSFARGRFRHDFVASPWTLFYHLQEKEVRG
jgi:hypothetical protein